MSTQITTGKARLSYPNLFTPKAFAEGAPEKYSCVLLIPKTDKKTIRAVEAAIEEAKEAAKTSKFGGKIPNNLKTVWRDGDEEADLERNPEYAGHYYLNVSATRRPGIVDRGLAPITDETEVYAGCYVRANINAFGYNANGSKGISFGLNHLQKVADGEPFGNVSRVEDVFDALDDEDDDDDLLG